LSNEERDKAAARVFSSGRDRLAPRVHRRGAEGAVRLGGYEVARRTLQLGEKEAPAEKRI